MSLISKIFGDPNEKVVKQMYPTVDKINNLEEKLINLTLEELKNKTQEFKDRLKNSETLDDLLPEAFAVVREVSKRVTGMRHFDVQLIGGIVLHRGQITEMRTGEGKTLVATLPVYLNALTGKGVHVVTVNDYLAKRDAVWMSQIYDALGLSVGIVQQMGVSYKYNASVRISESDEDLLEENKADKERDSKGTFKVKYDYLEECTRAESYQCDIIYGTNNEYGFDYLRDNMVQSLDDMVQRKLNYAIIDEVDSILIDEARTPLIISAPAEEAADIYYKFADLIAKLNEENDYNVDEKMKASTLSESGMKKMEEWLGIDNIYAEGGMSIVHHVEQALRARALFKLDRDYVVENDEVVIVDEFTGRKMVGRRYSEGLHQAIEAKEKVKIQRESRTMATVTFQNYFRMYNKLSGMTGTAVTEAEEFGKIYGLEVVVIPTNKPIQRVDHPDRIYRTHDLKFKALAKKVRELQEKGQPVLIGTISVQENEALSLYLMQEGISHEILNAKNHEREGEIVAQAGSPGSVTLATNMAGRGVDIILGGNPTNPDTATKVRDSGGLFVVCSERHESRRIDNQLRGRAGRQGDPGESQFYLSTEDDLMRIFAGDRIRSVMKTLRVPDDMPIEQKSITKIIESAQKKVEGFHFDSRKHLLEYDDVLNKHREVVYGNRSQVLEYYKKEKAELDENKIILEDINNKITKTLRQMILEMIENEIEAVVSFHTNADDVVDWNLKEIYETIQTIFELSDTDKNQLTSLGEKTNEKFVAAETRTKIIDYFVELSKNKYESTLVNKLNDPVLMLEVEKQILLRSIDNLWIEHLVNIDFLRTGIGLRGYGQRDPLVEYKKETYKMFNELLSTIQKEVVYSIYKVSIGLQLAPSIMQKDNMILSGAQKTQVQSQVKSKKLDKNGNQIGRNDPCYCGSGKKYKKCCGL